MKRMRQISLILFLALMSLCMYAQEAPQHRVVYLWDVTYSTHGGRKGKVDAIKVVPVGGKDMKIVGYSKKYDIYEDLVKALKACINQQNPESEIIVVPFNDKVLTDKVWRAMGTKEGKDYLIKNIDAFYDDAQTHTNIHAAFEYAKEHLFTPKAQYWSDLFIFTDGGHTDKRPPIPSRDTFHSMLRQWCDFAEPNNIHGYYFLLTDVVYQEDPELETILEESPCLTAQPGIPTIGFVPPTNQFTILGDQVINIKENYDEPIRLKVQSKDVERPIRGAEQIHIYASKNPYLTFDQVITIEGENDIELKLNYSHSLSELQNSMPTDCNAVVILNFEQVGEKKVNELLNSSCTLQFVNKPQKTLWIEIKQ